MKTTFSRTFTTAAAILLITLLALGTSFQALVRDYLTDNTVSALQNDAQVISNLAASYSIDGSLSSWDFLLNLDVASQVSDADVVICDAYGTVILCSDGLAGCEHQGLRLNREYLQSVYTNNGNTSTCRVEGLYDDERYVVALPIMNDDGTIASGIVMLSSPTASINAILARISRMFVTVAMVVVLMAVTAVSAFARSHSRPLKAMARAATDFGHGNLEARVRIDEDYAEEVEELALAFNSMAAMLQKSEYQRQEFVANVSHELKTPMTTISGYVDGILDGTIPENRQEYYLRLVSEETKRLSRLVRSMLDISRLQSEGGIPDEKKLYFDLEECVGQVLITFEQKINAKRLEVEVELPEHPVNTIAQQDAVTQVVYNLIDNAVKFCAEGGQLGLKIREGGGKIYISVSNQGQTIPAEELPLVFDRFHKTDQSRTRNRDGWGLGLYIVKTIVCSHGENISVSSREGKTEFTFTLPLVN